MVSSYVPQHLVAQLSTFLQHLSPAAIQNSLTNETAKLKDHQMATGTLGTGGCSQMRSALLPVANNELAT